MRVHHAEVRASLPAEYLVVTEETVSGSLWALHERPSSRKKLLFAPGRPARWKSFPSCRGSIARPNKDFPFANLASIYGVELLWYAVLAWGAAPLRPWKRVVGPRQGQSLAVDVALPPR